MAEQTKEVIISPDEIDRGLHEIEARNWAMAADRACVEGEERAASAFAAVSQAHSLVAFTQLFGKSAT